MNDIAGPPYRTESQWHGPCYVLDPDEWMRGWREVVAVIPAIPPRRKRPRPSWHSRARGLRARGFSVRAIMRTLHIRSYRMVYDVLAKGY